MFDPIIEQLVQRLRGLPSIGERSARRMAMHLCRDPDSLEKLIDSLQLAQQQISPCQSCRNFCSQKICSICADEQRQLSVLCVVAQPQDILAIESSGAYKGQYFVLHGLLSPLDNIGSTELGMPKLIKRFETLEELVLALPYTVEGEATVSLLSNQAANYRLAISRLAQGIPSGGDVASMDDSTLSQALSQRQRFTNSSHDAHL